MEDKNVTIILKVSQWNVVMAALANGKFSEVSSVIAEIQQQARTQVEDSSTGSASNPPVEN